MAFTYDLTSSTDTRDYSSAWFAVFLRYQKHISFDRKNAVTQNLAGKSVSYNDPAIFDSRARKETVSCF